MNSPVVSIIIPVWNSGDVVKKIVTSILSQEYSDFELILVDDGSSDNTLEVLHELKNSDPRIKVFTKPNGGPSSARNLGLDHAAGTYIQFYDADDGILPGSIEKIVNTAETLTSDLVVSGWQIDLQTTKGLVEGYKQISPKRQTVDQDITGYVLRSLGESGTLYNLWNKLFRADIIQQNGLRFLDDVWFGEDLIFSMQYLKYTRRLDIIPDITYRYQTNSSSSVFSSTSLIPGYRKINDEALVAFAGDNLTTEQNDLLQWLRWRWLISYWSLVASCKKPYKDKLGLVAQFKPTGLGIAKKSKHIGFKKLALENLANIARASNVSSLLLGWSLSMSKKLVKSVKLLKKQPKL